MGLPDKQLDHEYFEELAALSELGELSAGEAVELKVHVRECSSCRQAHAAFSDILLTQLPLAHREKGELFVSEGRVQQAGTWSRIKAALTQPVPLYTHAAALFLIITVGAFGYWWSEYKKVVDGQVVVIKESVNGERKAGGDDRSLGLSRLRNDLSGALGMQPTHMPPLTLKDGQVKPEVVAYERLIRRTKSLELDARNASSEIEFLKQALGDARSREVSLSGSLDEATKNLDRITSELAQARAVQNQSDAAIRDRETNLVAARDELTSAQEVISRTQRLLAADRDIRDLMSARNLRIVDIFDVDGKGKTRKPFGRVFFTEGKSLIFYAFDLEGTKPSVVNASYQAWGYQGSAQTQAQSLGVFYRDDQKSNRWVLKFDDPSVLAEIDSVFVTVEPSGGSKKPTGNKLLAAYMKANLNHP